MIPRDAPVVTAARMRAAEEAVFRSGVSQDALMERAGAAVAREAARFAFGRPILVLAGPGNNGGDAYVAARLLRESGHDVTLTACGEPGQGAAARMAALSCGHASAQVHVPCRCRPCRRTELPPSTCVLARSSHARRCGRGGSLCTNAPSIV